MGDHRQTVGIFGKQEFGFSVVGIFVRMESGQMGSGEEIDGWSSVANWADREGRDSWVEKGGRNEDIGKVGDGGNREVPGMR